MPSSEELRGAVAGARAANSTVGSKAMVERFRHERGWAEVDNRAVKAAIEALQEEAAQAEGNEADGAPAPSVEEEAGHECFYCGMVGKTMKCEKCAEKNVASPGRYCSEACQKAHWPAHLKWHRKLKVLAKMNNLADDCEDRAQTRLDIEEDAKTGNEVAKLLAKGSRFLDQQNFKKAVKAFNEALEVDPTESAAHHNLAVTFSRSNERPTAAHHALLAARWAERKVGQSAHWARSWGVACALLLKPECDEVPRPAWWNDAELLQRTKRVIALIPNETEIDVWQTRAVVLAGIKPSRDDAWEPLPRSCKQLKEAVKCLTRQGQLIPYMAEPCQEVASRMKARVAMMQMLGLDVEPKADLDLGQLNLGN